MFCASASVTRWHSSDCWRSSRNCWSRSERTASHASTRLGSRTAITKTSATFFICLLVEILQLRLHNQAHFEEASFNQKRNIHRGGDTDLANGKIVFRNIRSSAGGSDILDRVVVAVKSTIHAPIVVVIAAVVVGADARDFAEFYIEFGGECHSFFLRGVDSHPARLVAVFPQLRGAEINAVHIIHTVRQQPSEDVLKTSDIGQPDFKVLSHDVGDRLHMRCTGTVVVII